MNKPITLLFPTGSFYPAQSGGPDNTVYWITKAITRKGLHAIVSSTDVEQPETTQLNTWLKTDYGEVIYTHNPIHYLPIKVIRRGLSRISEVDIIQLSMITYPAAWLTALWNSWFIGKPMVWSSRGDLDPPMLLRSRRKKAFVMWLINTFVNKKLVTFHSTCAAETSYVQGNFGTDARIVQIPNYMELPERSRVPKEKYLLFIGRIDRKKAIENLIEALNLSNAFRSSEFVLKLVGDHHNPYGKRLMGQARAAGLEHKIQFLGHRTGVEKEDILAGAWFSFVPSHSENYAIVVTESMAQGTPVVASQGTPWEILEEHDAGYWVDNAPESFKNIIDKILLMSEERVTTMGENALTLIQNRFNIHANVQEWITTYENILKNHRPE